MATHFPLAHQEVVTLMVRITDKFRAQQSIWSTVWRQIGAHLSHNDVRASRVALCTVINPKKATGPIIASIWRKWDIVNNCPLPDGVERVWSERDSKSEVVWKKTGNPYYIFVSKSSPYYSVWG